MTIDAICSRLDYLPLAIELAAARTATLPPDALLSRLSQPLTILRNGPRDVPLRHQTMRDTIAWSYDLLDDDRRAGFRQLSVFVGGFTLEGAQAILGNDSDALDLVEFLVARSLVVPMPGESSAPRFAMLESIRQFGVDELVASGDDEATRRAQADYLIALAENAIPFYDGPHLYFYLSRVVDEMDNIRSAMRWSLDCRDGIRANRLAGAIWRLWQNGEMRWLANTPWEAHWAEGRSWLEQALALRESVPPAFQLEALSGMTYLLVTTGQHHQADRYAEELLDRAREAQDPLGEHWAHLAKADNARSRGDLLTARTEFAAALEAAQRSRDPDNQTCGAYVGLGRLELATGNLPEAEANLRTALTFGGISGNPHNLSLATVFLAIVCHQQGKADEAAQFALAGIRHLADIHDDARSQIPVLILAELALTSGQTLEAVRLVAYASTRPRFYGSTTIDEAKIAPFRAALPESAFSQEWEAGTRLSPEDIRLMAERIVEILDRDPSPPPTLIPTSLLSPREEEVLHLLVAGRTNRAIGQELFISERTVEKHVLHIMTKLDLDSRTGIVAWAVRNGVVA
ncbi:MAG: LuxR C-terminal-related transcriptional regulator [Thermomicrobiales bacterium]